MCAENVVFSKQSYDVWKVLDCSTGSIVDAGGLVSGCVHSWNDNRKSSNDDAAITKRELTFEGDT